MKHDAQTPARLLGKQLSGKRLERQKTLTRLMEMVWALKLKEEKVDRGSVTEWTFQ